MERKNNREEFIKKIFERSEDPMAQLERINGIVPILFADPRVVAAANKRLNSFGYQINDHYVSGMSSQYQMFSHPSCGSSSDYDSGHPSCGTSRGYGSGHPSCGSSNGYGSGHPSCGTSRGYGSGHPSCCSSKNGRESVLLIRRSNSGRRYGIRN